MEFKVDNQIAALNKWGFEKFVNGEYHIVIEGVEIQWNLSYQCGAYVVGGQLFLLHHWDELNDVMEQILY